MPTFDIYLRVSRVGGRENLISPAEQERRARELAQERGLTVGKVLTDLDESGGKWDRPGLQEALERVRSGQSGGLIVAWLDRLSRDSEHAHRIVRELAESGGTIYAPDAPSDWLSPEGELQAGIVFAFAQYIRKRARVGFERSKEQAIMRGIPIASRVPVGYRKRESDRRLEPDPDVAPVIRELFERRAAGEGPTGLCTFLAENGLKTSQGAASWTKSAVCSVIASRVYLGELSYGRDRRYVNPNAHEPLVDLSTWLAAQHPNGRQLQAPRGGGDYMLTGLLRCQACGYVMQGTRTSRSRRIYRCVRRHAGGLCPEPALIRADVVEAAAERLFWDAAHDFELLAEDSGDDYTEHLQRIERTERRLAQALSPQMQDAAGDVWAELVKERRREHEEAAQALGRARAARERERAAGMPEAATLRMMWPKFSPAERRELIASRLDGFALRRGADVLIALADGDVSGLSRRGYTREPRLRPIDPPASARKALLHEPDEGTFEPALRLVL